MMAMSGRTISVASGAAALMIFAGIQFVNAKPQAQPTQNQEEKTSERLLETVRSSVTRTESLIKSFRCQFSSRVAQGRYRGPEVTYFDYVVSGPRFRLIEKAVYPENSTSTIEHYWDGTTLTTYRSPDGPAEVSKAKPLQIVFTPFDAAGLFIGGAELGDYLTDLLSQTPPPNISREVDDFVQSVVVRTHDGRQRIWLDPARHFLPVKWEWLYSEDTAPGAGAVAEYTVTLDEIKEFPPGILLPTKWSRIRGIGPPAPKDAWGLPERVERYEASLIELNQDYPLEMFSPDAREGSAAKAKSRDRGSD